MKINHYLDRSWFNGLRYTLHIMKIIIILLVLSIGNSFYDLLSKYITFA